MLVSKMRRCYALADVRALLCFLSSVFLLSLLSVIGYIKAGSVASLVMGTLSGCAAFFGVNRGKQGKRQSDLRRYPVPSAS